MAAVPQHFAIRMNAGRLGEGHGAMVCILQRNLRSKTKMLADTGQRKQGRKFIQRQIMSTQNMQLSLFGICRRTKVETAAFIRRIKGSDKRNIVKMLRFSLIRRNIGGKFCAKNHTLDGDDAVGQISQRKTAEKSF